MSWINELEQVITSLDRASHRLLLVVYEGQFMYDVILRRLQTEFAQHQWHLRQAPFSVRIVQYIKDQLAKEPLKAVTIHLDEHTEKDALRALNLIREQLYDLPTNIIFLVQKEAYHRLLTQAHDFVTWMDLPYHFTVPEMGLPDLPEPPVTIASSAGIEKQIRYYRDQILDVIGEHNQQELLAVFLPSLADLYLEAGMYETAISVYEALVATDNRNLERYQQKLKIAEGWKLIANLNLGSIAAAERDYLQDLLNKGKFSVQHDGNVLKVVDETGHSRSASSELIIRLGIVSEKIHEHIKEIKQGATDPNLLLFDAEQAHTYWARRYGIGYNAQHIQWDIQLDGSAVVERSIDIEAYADIDSLDTYLAIPERSPDGAARRVGFESIESLSPDRSIEVKDQIVEEHLRRLSAKIVFSPRLSEGERTIYKMRENLTPTYAINVPQHVLEKREAPYDYSGWNINRPTRRLSMQVIFPENIRPAVYNAEVRYASTSGFPSERLHYEEHKRLRKPTLKQLSNRQYALQMEVNYPMIGLIYVLRWQPVG